MTGFRSIGELGRDVIDRLGIDPANRTERQAGSRVALKPPGGREANAKGMGKWPGPVATSPGQVFGDNSQNTGGNSEKGRSWNRTLPATSAYRAHMRPALHVINGKGMRSGVTPRSPTSKLLRSPLQLVWNADHQAASLTEIDLARPSISSILPRATRR